MNDNTTKREAALPEWADFERIEHDNGRITYESHGREDVNDYRGGNTFIVIDGHRAKEVADKIRASLATPAVPDANTVTALGCARAIKSRIDCMAAWPMADDIINSLSAAPKQNDQGE